MMSEPQFGLREMAETAYWAERERDKLQEELAAERTRREELEQRCRDFDEHVKHISQCWADDTRRAEQAERERDEHAHCTRLWRERTQRAEADNAALLKMIDLAGHSLGMGQVDTAVSLLLKASAGDGPGTHPGAAMLERMRALEEVHGVACEMNAGDSSTDAWTRLGEACSAVDALKPETK